MVGIKINKTVRNAVIVIAAIILVFAISSLLPEKNFNEKYEGYDLMTSVGATSATKTYSEYCNEHKNAKLPSASVNVDVLNFDASNSFGSHAENSFYGKDVVVTEDRSSVTWHVEVPEAGFYNISMEYIAIPSRNVNMERIYI